MPRDPGGHPGNPNNKTVRPTSNQKVLADFAPRKQQKKEAEIIRDHFGRDKFENTRLKELLNVVNRRGLRFNLFNNEVKIITKRRRRRRRTRGKKIEEKEEEEDDENDIEGLHPTTIESTKRAQERYKNKRNIIPYVIEKLNELNEKIKPLKYDEAKEEIENLYMEDEIVNKVIKKINPDFKNYTKEQRDEYFKKELADVGIKPEGESQEGAETAAEAQEGAETAAEKEKKIKKEKIKKKQKKTNQKKKII